MLYEVALAQARLPILLALRQVPPLRVQRGLGGCCRRLGLRRYGHLTAPSGYEAVLLGPGFQPTRYFSIASMSSDTPRPGSRGTS